MNLKALAVAVLERNNERNNRATDHENPRNTGVQQGAGLFATVTKTQELTSLVRACGIAYAFTEDEHKEALQIALADPDHALTCFRAIAAELRLCSRS